MTKNGDAHLATLHVEWLCISNLKNLMSEFNQFFSMHDDLFSQLNSLLNIKFNLKIWKGWEF
jgi:hypothetical protein